MKLSEIYAVADSVAPKALSDEMCQKYGWYDNSGILVDTGEEITGIVFSLDLSEGAIDQAIAKNANLIITHHPAIYGKISCIRYGEEPLGTKLIRCIRQGISVVAMHLNLDSAAGGIDESLMQGVYLSAGQTTGVGTDLSVQLPLSQGAYGRAYTLAAVPLGDLSEGMKKVFESNRVEVYGDKNKRVTRVASFCGSGADERAIAFALAQGAEAIISSDFKHHVLSLALESGLSVVTLTHYASEEYGYQKYYEKISRQVSLPCSFYREEILL